MGAGDHEVLPPGEDPSPAIAGRSLAEVARSVGVDLPDGGGDVGAVRVGRAVLDSRRARPGDLYAALPGEHTHGACHAAAATASGAVAVLTDAEGARIIAGSPSGGAVPVRVPVLVVDDPRAALGPLAQQLAGDPARRLMMIGVTGTNGKTTTTALVESAIAAAGGSAGLIGTTGTRIDGRGLPGLRTTPEAPELAELLAAMVEAGVTTCAMEVSSHAVVMHRADGVVLDVVGFTQLSQDHLDLHGDMEHYFAAKASLFTPERARRAVVVVDDAWGARLADLCRERGLPVTTVSAGAAAGTGPSADITVVPGSVRAVPGGGSTFALLTPAGEVATATPLPGRFNVSNAALAHGLLTAAGLPGAAAALPRAHGPAGRMQIVAPRPGGQDASLTGVVDYAHTPDAVEAALGALRPGTPGRLVVVLGAGGDRDRGKRPAMGAAAASGADVVVVTDDNPRSEDPAAIRGAVLAGARSAAAALADRQDAPSSAVEIIDVPGRGAAIHRAVAAATAPGSTVLVAGKGHERGQEIHGEVHPFDDVDELAAALAAVVTTPALTIPATSTEPGATS